MTGEIVLIAAFSGRALAEAARRAGYVPLVVDAFGDDDTRAAAEHHAQIPNAVRNGFSAKPLFAALDALVARVPAKTLGIVLGSGFEDRPKLIQSLDRRYRLLGTKAETVAEVKDPRTFFPLLKQLGIDHPETSLTPPDDPSGWIAKRAGGAGGAHIRELSRVKRLTPSHYFQRRINGTPMAVSAIASKGGVAMELSRQWTAPCPRKPFRYGGATLIDYTESSAQQQMIATAATLIELLDPVGLLSFDFLVEGTSAQLLEINPRPGGTLEIFDDPQGNLFRAHIEAALGNDLWQRRDLPLEAGRASAILYADQGAVEIAGLEWPNWVADRPAPGTRIPAEQPIATVRATAPTPEEAESLARARLSQLAKLVYKS